MKKAVWYLILNSIFLFSTLFCSVANAQGSIESVGYYTTHSVAWGVAVNGNYAYIAESNYGLDIVDISNLTSPVELGHCAAPSNAFAVIVSGNYAYINDYLYGLRIIDISNPANPYAVGSCATPMDAIAIAVSGNYAYVTGDATGLRIIDISDPTNPFITGTCETNDRPLGVAVQGNDVYVADDFAGLCVIDASNPSNPYVLGTCSLSTEEGYTVAVSGNYAYVGTSSNEPIGILCTIDISNPANPVETGYLNMPGLANNMVVNGEYAYIANYFSYGLDVIDINDPTNPFEVGFYPINNACSVAVSGGYAFVGSYTGLSILKYSNINPPGANFKGIPNTGFSPLTVHFYDDTIGEATCWSWDFGDGGTSTTQNPIHVYSLVSSPTSYNVQLVISDPYGTSTDPKPDYIQVYPPPLSWNTNLPSLKLFSEQSINNAFFLEDYNTSGVATGYSIFNNFAGLATLIGSTENQGAYGSPTVGTNVFMASNAVGSSTADSLVKYSTYKIYKLPEVGLTVGSSWDVNLASYTYSSTGLSIPPSFGNPDAIIVSDTTNISATWEGNTIIQITSLQSFSGPVDVDVIASPNASSPFGIDIDKERIYVYTNLLPNSTFSTSNDTSIWMPFELAPGRTTLATQSWVSSYTDSAGTQANGVWQFTFADANGGVKSTPAVSDWVNITNGQWYTFRMRLVADSTNNSHQSFLYGYTNYPSAGTQTDIAANILFGVPTVWTWQEVPLLTHGSSTTGYPQFQLKAGGAGSIYIDEIQILNATPELVNARSNTQFHYLYGQFTTATDTMGWGQQLYYGTESAPGISVTDGLVLSFAGATTGAGQQGIKWTANNGVQAPGNAYSFPANVGHQVGVRLTLSELLGNFNSLGIVLVAAYGVQTAGQQDIGIPPSNLMAVAGVGVLEEGSYRAVGEAINPYYQGQFGIRSDVSGTVLVNDVDMDIDNDDPNFGDPTLFP